MPDRSQCRNRVSGPIRPYYFYLPANFDPSKYLSSDLLPFADEARYLVATIVRKAACGDVDDDGYARLHSRVLRKVLSGRRLPRIISSIVAEGVVDISPHIADVRSRGYRMAECFAALSHCRVRARDLRLLDRIQRERSRMAAEASKSWRVIHHQLKALQRSLSVSEEADSILLSLPSHTRLCQSVLVDRIRQGDFPFSVSTTGRCFNSITGLMRTLRPALRINGSPVGSVDLRCAQPALLALLMHASRTDTFGGLECSTYNDRSLAAVLASCATLDSARAMVVDPAELMRFRDLVCSGSFYDELSSIASLPRTVFKRRFLVDILAKKHGYPSPVEDLFRGMFPSVWSFIRAVNRISHGELIRLLQRLEAWLVIDIVAPRLVSKVPILTLHDEVFAPIGALEVVAAGFQTAFEDIRFSLSLKCNLSYAPSYASASAGGLALASAL